MEDGQGTVDQNLFLPSYLCLSPEEENSSSMPVNYEHQLAKLDVHEEEIDPAIPSSPLDYFNLVLPPTPDDSVNSLDTLLEEIGTDSSTCQEITTNENKEELLRSHSKQLSLVDTAPTACHLSLATALQTTLHAENIHAFLPETCQSWSVDTLTKQSQIHAFGEINSCQYNTQSEVETQAEHVSINVATSDPPSQQKEQDHVVKESSGMKEAARCTTSNARKEKKKKNPLKFPPCVICKGIASGSHYGAITCEACKGFFRRYLQKKIEYKCTKGGHCEIKSCNKGNLNCSSCRLKKCLEFGMSKDKSKMGRYTLTKRTEAIMNMNRLEGKEANNTGIEADEILPIVNETDVISCDPEKELLKSEVIQNVENLNRSKDFNDTLVSELMEAFDALHPFGQNIKTKEQITERHKLLSERYKQKVELFGHMKCVTKDEFNELYEEFGIDLDGRMADMKIESENVKEDIAHYYNFAKHIPGFYCLPIEDQIKLLKFSMNDFFSIVNIECYSEEYQTFIGRNGAGYHFEEIAGREFSRDCCTVFKGTFKRLQELALSKDEKALLAALSLVSTNRCKLKNYAAVEKIEVALSDLLLLQLQKNDKSTARKRFTKIIDIFIFTQDVSELVVKENNIFCKDDVMRKEFPYLTEFVLEENGYC